MNNEKNKKIIPILLVVLIIIIAGVMIFSKNKLGGYDLIMTKSTESLSLVMEETLKVKESNDEFIIDLQIEAYKKDGKLDNSEIEQIMQSMEAYREKENFKMKTSNGKVIVNYSTRTEKNGRTIEDAKQSFIAEGYTVK